MITTIKQKIQSIAHANRLKRMGYTEAQYDRAFDDGTNFRAGRVKDMYPGYPFLYELQYSAEFWAEFGGWEIGLEVMKKWLRENCQDKWRDDFHRVIKDHWGDWVINELGGSDILFVAFKNEQDCMWFGLRWS